jgi:hypothetical protein
MMATQRAFADTQRTPDNFKSFTPAEMAGEPGKNTPADSALGPVPPARSTQPMDLDDVLGADAVQKIQAAGKIVLHTVGDSGGNVSPGPQFAVADALAIDQEDGVSLFYHLGDVVYFFGEDSYYFEQFYDPYREYNAPIFAIPGNHDGAMYAHETSTPLQGFQENFCSAVPTDTPDNQGCARTTMDQPGVYFTLNAPFIKFIGLYSNIGEGGQSGEIASTRRADIGTKQLDFLTAALTQAKAERSKGNYRVIALATHHPPFTGSPFHVPSPGMLKMIDQVCEQVGIYPDIHLSGHSHLYERFTRTVKGRQIPYLVAGMAGYPNLTGLKKGKPVPVPQLKTGTDATGNPLKLENFNNKTFGFLRMTVSASELDLVFIGVDPDTGKTAPMDGFSLDLKTGVVTDTQNIPANTSFAQAASKSAAKTKKAAANKTANKKAGAKTALRKQAPKKSPVKKAPARKSTKK